MHRKIIYLAVCVFIMASVGHAGDNIQFLYQTRVFINDTPASGVVNMKFAVVGESGDILWTNDGTTGTEPAAAVSAIARNGVVSVEIGDSTLANMTDLHNIILHRRDGAKLRVWLDDTVSGFQQFTPDTGINPNFLYMPEVSEDLTLYVDGATGDDGNTGLSPSTALQTVQAAVDKLPKIVRDDVDVVIDIADGVYRELVTISGIRTGRSSRVTLLGDETTTATTAAAPSVRITASDDDVSRDRAHCLQIWDSDAIGLTGIQFDLSTIHGVSALDHSRVYVIGCHFTDCGNTGFSYGLSVSNASFGNVTYSRFDSNFYGGALVSSNGTLGLADCLYTNNPGTGIEAAYNSYLATGNTNTFTNNGYAVLPIYHSLYENRGTVVISGSVHNDMRLRWFSGARNAGTFPGSDIVVEAGSFSEGF